MQDLEPSSPLGTERADPGDVAWVLPGRHGSPAEALARMEALCSGIEDLFGALWAIVATHQGLPREILARAVKGRRAELAELGHDDVLALLTSIVNGGRPGFEAVLRSRKKGERGSAALPWLKD